MKTSGRQDDRVEKIFCAKIKFKICRACMPFAVKQQGRSDHWREYTYTERPGFMTGTKALRWLWVAVILISCTRCSINRPILIGFAGELTGINAGISVDGRDGALLAVEHLNEAGGINGRPIELVVRNDQGKTDVAWQVDRELIDLGVAAIIGHFTSGQTSAVYDQINQAEVVLLSPTSTSAYFSGKDDYFFRVIPDNYGIGSMLSAHIYNARGIRRIVGIYDTVNLAYTETVWQAVRDEFTRQGGEIIQIFTYRSGEAKLKDLIQQAADLQPEGVVFVSPSVDTALMAQYYRQTGDDALLFTVPWAQTDEFLQKGGRAVEGIEMTTFYDPDSQRPSFRNFVQAFDARFHRQPGFSSAYTYEAVLALSAALEKTHGSRQGLGDALRGLGRFKGVQGDFEIDQNGDVERDIYIAVVEGGRFRVIQVYPAAH